MPGILTDESAMRLALREARRGIGLTAPNPAVGAVLVRDGVVLGRGWHRKAGGPHAEVEAIRDAARKGVTDLSGATAYVTLEPCSSHGRTPPCVEALLAAGVARVVWGADDPDPRHAGRAQGLLEAAGVTVVRGICGAECQDVLRPFARRVTSGLPWVIAKAGMSLDGRITRPPGEGQWITGEAARADAMRLRAGVEAIVAGAETIRQDDPSLTIRGPALRRGKEQPWRAILTHSGDLPPGAQIFTDAHRGRTLICQGKPLPDVLRDLVARGVNAVLIEGGGTVLAQAFAAGLVDEVVFYTAPRICGHGRPVVDAAHFSGASVPLVFADVKRLGPDLKIRAFPVR